jgi:hypothetical protein
MTETTEKSGLPKFLFVGLAIATLGAAAVTNPTEAAYLNYAAAQFGDRFSSLCDGIELPGMLEDLQGLAQDTCNAAASTGQDLTIAGQSPVASAIGAATERQNFGIFSLYKTQALNQNITTIGVFGQFFSLPNGN